MKLLAFATSKLVTRLFSSIWINPDGFEKLQNVLARDVPVLFLPTHRSYADFILVSFLCFISGVPLPVIAAGMGQFLFFRELCACDFTLVFCLARFQVNGCGEYNASEWWCLLHQALIREGCPVLDHHFRVHSLPLGQRSRPPQVLPRRHQEQDRQKSATKDR